jgi:hypothetical protein
MRFSASFCVFPRPKKEQREILCATADCIARGVDCDRGRAKLALSRTPRHATDSPGSAGASAPTVAGFAITEHCRPHAIFCVLPRFSAAKKTTHTLSKQPVLPPTVHNTPASAFSLPRNRHTYDFFSVCSVSSVVIHGFRLKTPLWNKRMRYLPGLKPRLRFLARAIRGHVIPRSSAFFSGQKKDTHTLSKQPVLPPPFTTLPALLQASPDTATPTISFPCLPCLPW